jgi:hypothetical protein
MHRNSKAAFAVDEPGYPPCDSQPFLLIVRTRHVVTRVNVASDGTLVVRDTRMFQHMAGCTGQDYSCRGQRIP